MFLVGLLIVKRLQDSILGSVENPVGLSLLFRALLETLTLTSCPAENRLRKRNASDCCQ